MGTSSGGACVGNGGGDGGTSSGCGPTNCAGCCGSNGMCQDPVAISACGTAGVSCQFCLPGQACNSGQCQTTPGCGPANCFGCCQSGKCLVGTDDTACGTGGAVCQACSGNTCFALGAKSGGTCSNGRSCGSSVCAGGCCDGYAHCQGGHSNSYCGNGDGGPYTACEVCAGDCSSGNCVGTGCNAFNCGSGCCMPDGTCWQGAQDSAHCGGGAGSLCFDCGPGHVCVPAPDGVASICVAACSPENCQGCCAGGVCSTGTDPTSCGAGGSLCMQCGSGQSCVNGACLTLTQCGATQCAGCCDSTVCHTGTADSECGTGGATCQNCTTDGGTCRGGSCSP